MEKKESCLVLLSGGQDSVTCLFWAKEHYKKVNALTIDYGQRHDVEIEAAKCAWDIGEFTGIHNIVRLPIGTLISSSPLVSNSELYKYENFEEMEKIVGNKIENTFIPMRNTLFLTLAVNRALYLDCDSIVLGICEQDNANYPDCTREFLKKFIDMTNESLGNKKLLNFQTPLINLSKSETVELAYWLGDECVLALAYSHTSYDGHYPPTDNNHSNLLRAEGFLRAGKPDPLVIHANVEGLMELPDTENYKNVEENLRIRELIKSWDQ